MVKTVEDIAKIAVPLIFFVFVLSFRRHLPLPPCHKATDPSRFFCRE